jgi:FkbM family methyltransferase
MDSIRLGTWPERLLGRAHRLHNELEVRKEVLGTTYGGHCVCLDAVPPSAVVYSFGVGEDISFDLALIDRFGVVIHAFDPTPRVREFLSRQALSDRFRMHYYGLAATDGTRDFAPPENDQHISHTLLDRPSTQARAIRVPFKRLGTIMQELGHDRVDVLKMDIEGAEYEVIEDMLSSGIAVGQLLVEFHHHLPGVGFEPTRRSLRALYRAGYRVFHFSRRGTEISLMRP